MCKQNWAHGFHPMDRSDLLSNSWSKFILSLWLCYLFFRGQHSSYPLYFVTYVLHHLLTSLILYTRLFSLFLKHIQYFLLKTTRNKTHTLFYYSFQYILLFSFTLWSLSLSALTDDSIFLSPPFCLKTNFQPNHSTEVTIWR